MTGGFPIGGSLANPRSVGAAFAAYAYGGTAVTPSDTANTKGSYTQLTAATSGDTSFMVVKIGGSSNGTAFYSIMVDIAIGGSGSEVVIASNLLSGLGGTYCPIMQTWFIPISIPDGTRIAARAQTNAATPSATIQVSVVLYDGDFATAAFAGVDDIGSNTGTTLGGSVSLGNGTKGSYTQLTASTSRDYEGLAVAWAGSGAAGAPTFDIDVAIGGSGSEVIVVPDIYYYGVSGEAETGFTTFVRVPVPAGTRIAVRGSCLTGSTGTTNVVVYGLYK